MLRTPTAIDRLKVAFVCTLYAPNEVGGAERAVRVLAEALVAAGHQAVVISLSPNGKYSSGEINGVTVYYVPLANIHWPHAPIEQRPPWRSAIWHLIDAYNPVMGARVRKILAREKPDVLETNNLQGFSVAVWRAAQRLNIPVVQVLHDYYLGCPNSAMFRHGRNCRAQCGVCAVYTVPRKLLSNIPQVVSSVSRRMLERLEACGLFDDVPRKAVPRKAVPRKVIVPTAFDVFVEPAPRGDKLPRSHLTIGYLGRLEETKGVEVLLRAMLELPPESVTLLVAGNGAQNYVDGLKQKFSRPNIHFLGFTEPATFFQKIDALVVPSVWEEPLGRVIFEGFAFGVPAIVARIGGMPEIVEPDVTGYVFEPGDSSALARLLREIIERGLPASRLRAACYEKSRGFGVNDVLRAHLSSWRSAIHSVRPAQSNSVGAEKKPDRTEIKHTSLPGAAPGGREETESLS